MNEQKNVQLVKKIYSSFKKGDIQFIVDSVADDVDWELVGAPEIPYACKRHGRGEVEKFFRILGETVEIQDFEPKEFIAQGNKVVVLGHDRVKNKATGRAYENDWAMYFTLRRGKIAKHICYEDTAAALRALKAA